MAALHSRSRACKSGIHHSFSLESGELLQQKNEKGVRRAFAARDAFFCAPS
jgi:hypothetical protein